MPLRAHNLGSGGTSLYMCVIHTPMRIEFEPAPRPQDISPQDWMDWRWQVRNRLKRFEDFSMHFALTESEIGGLREANQAFKVQATPYYASLAEPGNIHDPIRRMMIPLAEELSDGKQAMSDPLAERKYSPAPRIVHRYPDRVLFLVTDTCSVYCRYCLRKHFTGHDEAFPVRTEYQAALDYIKNQSGIREVILSGGDPLTLGDERIEEILKDLSQIPHLDLIRIGTRMPVVNPMRITNELVSRLKIYHPIFIMTHFNHAKEVTYEAAKALLRLVDNGFPVLNQMVLLRGINDSAEAVEQLSRRLLRLRVKPYYMHQCDPSLGTDHFRTSIRQSLKIQRELWGKISGLALPQLSVDLPGGGGKVGLVPDFLIEKTDSHWRFRGWDGVESTYIEPGYDHNF